LGEGLRCFLGQVVTDPLEIPVRIIARELFGVRVRRRVGCSIGITFEGNGGHADDRGFEKFVFQIVVFRLALRQPQPPAIVMDRDRDVVRVIEGGCAAIKCGVIKVPFRGSKLPDKLREFVRV
jgi:hypothetical protein